MSTRKNRKHSEEFKQEAVRLALESGKPKTQIARELDISEGLLYTWILKYDEATSRGLSIEDYQQEKTEMRRLKAEINGGVHIHHIHRLMSAGFIIQKREGRILYCIAELDALIELTHFLESQYCTL